MPYEPTVPVAQNSLDTFQILELSIALNPTDANDIVVRVQWVEGYMDGPNFVAKESKKVTLSGAPVTTKMAEAPNGADIYNVIKNGIWELLASEGHIPEGSVT